MAVLIVFGDSNKESWYEVVFSGGILSAHDPHPMIRSLQHFFIQAEKMLILAISSKLTIQLIFRLALSSHFIEWNQ